MTDVPGFLAPVAEGHVGEIRSYDVGGVARSCSSAGPISTRATACGPSCTAIRHAAAAGVRLAVLTNANGSLREDWELGRPVLVADHLNLTGDLAAGGAAVRRPDRRLVAAAAGAGPVELDPSLAEGVYAWLRGPHYETWAEAEWLRRVGADLLGMSTVPEAIAAREWQDGGRRDLHRHRDRGHRPRASTRPRWSRSRNGRPPGAVRCWRSWSTKGAPR